MTKTIFSKAQKSIVAPKIAIMGASGSGKTYGALRFARGFVGPEGRVAVIDTENGSASLYADAFDFDAANIAPNKFDDGSSAFWHVDFRDAIDGALEGGYDILIIDSASHLWKGVLAYKSRLDEGGGNGFANWKKPGDAYQVIIDKILQAPIPVVCCFRSKTSYVLESDENGKNRPVKVGLAPIARDETEYEFTTMFDVDRAHVATAVKDRTRLFLDAETITEKTGERFRNWLDGVTIAKKATVEREPLSDYNQQTAEVVIPQEPDAYEEAAKPLTSLKPIDVKRRAVALGHAPEAVENAARRKFGAGLDDLAEDNLRYIFDNLKPKKNRV